MRLAGFFLQSQSPLDELVDTAPMIEVRLVLPLVLPRDQAGWAGSGGRHDPGQVRALGWGEREVEGRERRRQLVRPTGTDNDHVNRRVAEHPGERERRQRHGTVVFRPILCGRTKGRHRAAISASGVEAQW